jgi:predicted PurR-regulated permease PerM
MRLRNMNKKYTQIAIYVIITAIIIDSLKFFLGYSPALFEFLVDRLSWGFSVIQPVILGFIFAYLLEPIVSFLEEQFKKIKFLRKKQDSCRAYAIFTTLLIIIAILASIISLLVYSVTNQLKLASLTDLIVLGNEYADMFNDFYKNIMTQLNELNIESAELSNYIKEVSSRVLNFIQGLAVGFLSSVTNITGYISTFIFGIIIAIYFLIDGKMIKGYTAKVFRALFSHKVNKDIKDFVTDADMVFSGYIRGQLLDALVMMVLISTSLSIAGVKFAIVIGICAGIGNLIPYVGPFVAYAGTILVCVLNGEYSKLFVAIIVLFVIQALDGNVIGPKLLSNSINIHPLLVIISLIFGSAIGGLLGMLLAVPVGALIKVMFVKFIDSKLAVKEKSQ